MSLAEQIYKLTTPIPTFNDPEDITDESRAKLLSHEVDDDDELGPYQPSKLRSRAAVLQGEVDAKYSGKRTSRSRLMQDDRPSETDSDEISDDSGNLDGEVGDEDAESDDVINSGGDMIQSDEEEEEELAGFKEKLKFQEPDQKDFSYEDDGDYEKYGTDEDDDDSDDSDDDGSEGSGEEEEEDELQQEKDDDMQQFTKVDVEGEIQKGKAVKSQLAIWDGMLEGRIKLQKAVVLVNQLPQPDMWNQFMESGGTAYNKAIQESASFLQKLLEQLVELQTDLFLQNPETKHLAMDGEETSKSTPADGDDEEITSESEDEEKTESSQSQPSSQSQKRKLKSSQYPEFLAKRHKDFCPFRNTMIQKWYDKTRVASGRISKGFSAFEQSAVRQIEQILSDKDRLIKRTQLRRSAYKVLGKTEKEQEDETPDDAELNMERAPSRDHLRDYDEEIFDDDDFYHQQLRELIERKTADINDPIALSRQWLEIQKLRRKTKKNVDTKASKGRKIRYDVHKKLVNFMAPYNSHHWSDDAKNELYKSLFGKPASQSSDPAT